MHVVEPAARDVGRTEARRRVEREELAARRRVRTARLDHPGLVRPAKLRQAPGGGADPAPRELADHGLAHALDRVAPAIHLELAPHGRNASRTVVTGLVRVAAGLAPGPQGRAEAELVLQLLVEQEVAIL